MSQRLSGNKSDRKPTRIRRSAEETRKLIIRASRAELVASGSEIEVNQIAKRAGLSEGVVYYHFGNRKGLLDAMVRDHYFRLDEQVALIRFDGVTWVAREQARIRAMVDLYFDDPSAILIASIVRSDPQLVAYEAERRKRLYELGAKNIAEAQGTGEIKVDTDPQLLASMLLTASETAIIDALQRVPQLPRELVEQQIVDFLRLVTLAPQTPADAGV